MHGLPITAAVREVLSLLKLRLQQSTADTGVAVSVHPVGEPRARDADLGGVAALDHAAFSVEPSTQAMRSTIHQRVVTTAEGSFTRYLFSLQGSQVPFRSC